MLKYLSVKYRFFYAFTLEELLCGLWSALDGLAEASLHPHSLGCLNSLYPTFYKMIITNIEYACPQLSRLLERYFIWTLVEREEWERGRVRSGKRTWLKPSET